jgi:hypothetical protein
MHCNLGGRFIRGQVDADDDCGRICKVAEAGRFGLR